MELGGVTSLRGRAALLRCPPDRPLALRPVLGRRRGGTGGLLFTPDRPITREEAAILLRRYAARLGRDVSFPEIARCNDFEDISPWADNSLYWATGTGLIGWSEGGRLDPQGTLTQAQLDAILTRFSQ